MEWITDPQYRHPEVSLSCSSGLGLHRNEFAVVERFGAANRNTIARFQLALYSDIITAGLVNLDGDAFDFRIVIDAHDECAILSQYHRVPRNGQCDVRRQRQVNAYQLPGGNQLRCIGRQV